jgi:hypothetical protein
VKEYKILHLSNLPCWTKLSWDSLSATISLHVHQDVVQILDGIKADDPRVIHMGGNQGQFINQPDRWGFEGKLSRTSKTVDGFHGFHSKLPRIKKYKTDPCHYCDGTGTDEGLDQQCLFCNGEKRESYYDWKEMYALSTSLSLLTDLINHVPPQNDTSSVEQQILSFSVYIQERFYPLFGEYSPLLVDWFRRQGERSIDEAVDAMCAAWEVMEGPLHPMDRHSFYANIAYSNGWLNIGCPGDACGLHPSHDSIRLIGGYEFSCHNMDNPMQQFVLLTGLAAIEMIARKTMGT